MTHLDSQIKSLEDALEAMRASYPICRFSGDKLGHNRCIGELPVIDQALNQKRMEIDLLKAQNIHLQMVEESRKPETFQAIPPGDVAKMTQTNDMLKFAAIIAGILVLSS